MSPSRAAAFVAALLLLVGCRETSDPGAGAASPPAASTTTDESAEEKTAADPCAQYPPPFEASYLPEGFERRLRRGAGLFQGGGAAGYPTEGLLGHYRGAVETVHVDFETRTGPLPYEPANPHPLRDVLGRRGAIGKIEGGWAVEFSLGVCDFRMDAYGIDRAETVAVARGLREKS
ncbi:MAG TPA: hypothetical protein VHJ76_07740 [Actinomycetota bacterium]|nr:hypothetical protein [Actinomycetota bacterium]